jgi:hypothetical protein
MDEIKAISTQTILSNKSEKSDLEKEVEQLKQIHDLERLKYHDIECKINKTFKYLKYKI